MNSSAPCSSTPLTSRRRFLEGCAATLGVALVGCAKDGGPQTLVATGGEGGVWTLASVPEIAVGAAQAFEFPEKKPGLLFRLKTGEVGAVNAVCTHAGCTVQWNEGAPPRGPVFRCPCHASQFTANGSVVGGPAKAPLPAFTARDLGEGKWELRANTV